MAIIRPFRALRPAPEWAGRIACPPYDVVSRDEAAAIRAQEPSTFLQVVRSDTEFPPEDEHSEAVYQRAHENLQKMIDRDMMRRDPASALFLYRLATASRSQTGVVACASLDEYDRGDIRIHEKTRPEKEKDRIHHLQALEGQAEPVFLAYRQRPEIDALVGEELRRPPVSSFVAADGVQHTVWLAPLQLAELFLRVPRLYIADGHHRSAAASQVRTACRRSNTRHRGDESYNFFLAVLFPHDQLAIGPYNRLILQCAKTPDEVLGTLSSSFEITPIATGYPERQGEFCFYLPGQWYRLRYKGTRPAEPVAALDVSIAQCAIIERVFEIADPRRDPRIGFVGGGESVSELERAVLGGRAFAAISLWPVTLDDLFRVSDAGQLMPPKSTWFEPKLRSGLFVHLFRENRSAPFETVS